MSTEVAYGVVELRRYRIREGQRQRFARYFETYFPEALQQLGAVLIGHGLERDEASVFTWLRAYRDMNTRATASAAFYYGPVWAEHKATMNELMLDSDNVLLLRPLRPADAPGLMPAVDPLEEPHGARGVLVAQILAVKPECIGALPAEADAFDCCEAHGVQRAALLVSLDAPNNFPQLPVRSDGPFMVWLGTAVDEATLRERLRPSLQAASHTLSAHGLLRAAPELLVMDPTARSRLRSREAPRAGRTG